MRSLLFVVVTLAACGGTQESVNQPAAPAAPTGSATPAKPTTSGDVSFEVPAIDVRGAVYEPEALGRPNMLLFESKRKTTIEKQRALLAGTRDPVVKQAQAAVLATMLYLEIKNNKPNEKTLLGEARQILRDVAQQVGDKDIDEVTLRLLGSYELLLEDYAAAEKAWQTLIDKDPKDKEILYSRAFLVYSQLKQFKNAEALASANVEKYDDKQFELAYITAWARLRTGDGPGAWQAISTAVRAWNGNGNRDKLEDDVFLIAARANVSFDQARATVALLAKPRPEYEQLVKLGLVGYGPAGRWADGIASLDKAVEAAGGSIAPSDLIVIRFLQADYAVALDRPEAAAAYAKQSLDALAACGARCTDKADTVQRIYNLGRLLHNLYATANDRRFYQPAHDVYAAVIPQITDAAARAEAQKVSDILEKTLKNTKTGTGTHDKGTLTALLNRHTPEVQACYEAALGTNPKLGGTITLNLESDASGAIKGVATEPKAGAAELSSVAGCVDQHARQWKLPKRGMPGNTRIKMSYTLAVRK